MPRHLCLSVPASQKLLDRAREMDVDEVVLDLEDAIRPEGKVDARAALLRALGEGEWSPAHVTVRVNGRGTPWGDDDLAALSGAPEVGSVIVPKADAPADVAWGAGVGLPVQALIESARGLGNVAATAGAEGLEALILGYADLAASLGRSDAAARDLALWGPAQHDVLLAARANGIAAVDGPWLGTADDDAFHASVARAAALGFDGKWVIHPGQLAGLRAAFAPTDDEVAWARRVLDALDGAAGGAVALDGQMLDEAVAVAARRLLERAR